MELAASGIYIGRLLKTWGSLKMWPTSRMTEASTKRVRQRKNAPLRDRAK